MIERLREINKSPKKSPHNWHAERRKKNLSLFVSVALKCRKILANCDLTRFVWTPLEAGSMVLLVNRFPFRTEILLARFVSNNYANARSSLSLRWIVLQALKKVTVIATLSHSGIRFTFIGQSFLRLWVCEISLCRWSKSTWFRSAESLNGFSDLSESFHNRRLVF